MSFKTRWQQLNTAYVVPVRERIEKQLTVAGFFGLVFLIFYALPDWKSRLDFWSPRLRLDSIAAFLLSGWGRFTSVLVGLAIIWLDHRRQVSKYTAPASAPTPEAQPAKPSIPPVIVPAIVRPKSGPNVEMVEVRNAYIRYDTSSNTWKERKDGYSAYSAIVIEFQNRASPERTVSPASNIVAELVYSDGPILNTAAWLGTIWNYLWTLDIQDRAVLVLGFAEGKGAVGLNALQYTAGQRFDDTAFQRVKIPLEGSVEVRLIFKTGTILGIHKFAYSLRDGAMKAEYMPERVPVGLWSKHSEQ
jgi:hypothetical protein